MSEREKLLQLVDAIPDYKMCYAITYPDRKAESCNAENMVLWRNRIYDGCSFLF